MILTGLTSLPSRERELKLVAGIGLRLALPRRSLHGSVN